MKKAYKITNILLIAFFSGLILMRLFYNLGAYGITDLDEGVHAAEAYEMFHRKAWIAHTYYWEIDYFNSKPPLYFWLSNITFSLLGVSFGAYKLPSCIAAVITCTILSVFVYKVIRKRTDDELLPLSAVTVFLGAFISMDYLFDHHMFRAGNFDSVYCLFMMAGILFVIKAQEDNRYLIPMGAMAGLAFLSKGFNATAIVLSAICCIPFLAKEKRIKNILLSVLTATIVVLPWAALRFKFDGTKFFYYMFFGEADDKITGFSWGFFQWMPTIITFRLLVYGLVFYFAAIGWKAKSLKEFWAIAKSDLRENAILWVWFWVPILFYSWAGQCNEWYIYSSCILAAVLFAIYAAIGAKTLATSKTYIKVLASAITVIFLILMAANAFYKLSYYHLAGTGGGYALQLWGDIKEIKEKYGDEYQGSYVYIQDISHYDDITIRDDMFYDMMAYAEFEGDWHCVKGGIDAWENAEEGILVVNKKLFEQYYDRLAGHVIIYDNGYLYFSHDMY